MSPRRLTILVALTLMASTIGLAAAGAATGKGQKGTWVGHVQRDGNHFDYTGRACPVEAQVCTMNLARYRIVPTTRQARFALFVVEGGQARLRGRLVASGDTLHDGTLRVNHVARVKEPRPPTTGTTTRPPRSSGVYGTVKASPTCPVEHADEPCRPVGVEADLHLLRKDGSEAASGRSLADGSFRMEAAPGRYTLHADGEGRFLGGCQDVDVTVRPRRFTQVKVSCDTGIR